MNELQGAIIGAAIFQVFIGYSGLMGVLLRYISPITIAPTIALVGLALTDSGVSSTSLRSALQRALRLSSWQLAARYCC